MRIQHYQQIGFVRTCVLIMVCQLAMADIPSAAADRVDGTERTDVIWFEPPSTADKIVRFSPRSVIQRSGQVESIDDKRMLFVEANPVDAEESSSLSQMASSRVIWVEPGFDDDETIAAIEKFRSGNAKESIAPLLEAINRRPSVWRAQWLSMHLWQAAYQSQRYPATLELVNQLDVRPLPAMIIGGLPIHWTSERLPPEAYAAGNQMLANDASLDATKLVAASWLLGQPGDAQAVAVLESMAKQNTRPTLAQLAAVLLWRKSPPPAIRENRRRWQSSLSLLPMTMLPGPTFLLADRLRAAGDQDTSLELFLSVAMTPARPHSITTLARSQAAELLIQLGQSEAAKRLVDTKP